MTGAIPTIAEAARAIAERQLSPVELTRACLDRVRKFDGDLNAFVHLTEERALADARAAEAVIMAHGPKGPLHGIPIGLKDIVDTKGIPTTCQSKLLQDNIPDADATCAEKLAAAGTVLVGKTTTHEFADGGPSFDLPKPPARNPWNTEHFTAGSSSGTGAGVAAGLILGGIGTDTGGSIRGPAALCGIAGIKPTYGLVSRAGVAPAAFSLDHIGPMAWTAEDCALMLQALAGHDPRDPASAARPIPNYTAQLGSGVKDLKIGVIHHFHETDHKVSDGTQRGITAAIGTFRDLGAEIREVQLSPLQDWLACGSLISITERA
ncbi:MAG TPA: amidase, partial [Stellaceae bacterium]|nr:amidase [Stellaceae bacterium]